MRPLKYTEYTGVHTSPKDRDFLRAMSEDDGPSMSADIGRRLGDRKNTISNYRARLIDAGLVQPAGRGRLDFALPGLREHLRQM